MHHPTDRITHTTAFVTPVVEHWLEREIAPNLMAAFVNKQLSENTTELGGGGGARCSSVVRAFAHDATDRRIDPSWGGPIELFLVPTSAPRLV